MPSLKTPRPNVSHTTVSEPGGPIPTKTPKPHLRAPSVQLTVTDDLIDKCTVKDSAHCMLAEAVKEAYPDATRVAVDLQTIRFSDNRGRRYTYLTPRLAQVALVKFDQGSQTITPFSVKLRNGVATMRTPRGPVSAAKHRDANAKRRAKRAAERAAAAGAGGRPSVRAGTNKRLKQESGRDETSLRPTGGEPPPRSPVLADPPIPGGRRRTFGLRALDL